MHTEKDPAPLLTAQPVQLPGAAEQVTVRAPRHAINKMLQPGSHKTLEHRIAWLAGLLDGEGCIYMGASTRKHTTGFIDCKVGLEMTHRETVEYAASIMRELSSDPFRVKARKKRAVYKKQHFTVHASSQQGTLQLLAALWAYMVTKQTEARLALVYLRRAADVSKYRATESDREIAECVRRLKKSDPLAHAAAIRILEY